MEVEELMIGDLVSYKGDSIIVYGINQSFVDGQSTPDVINYQTDGFYGISYIRIDEVSPIPLSVDILMKSGFEQKNHYNEITFHCLEEGIYYSSINIMFQNSKWVVNAITFSKVSQSDIIYEFEGHIQYVHELQHIFRMLNIEKKVIL